MYLFESGSRPAFHKDVKQPHEVIFADSACNKRQF